LPAVVPGRFNRMAKPPVVQIPVITPFKPPLMSSGTVRLTMLEKLGTLRSPCGMFWFTVKERFVVVCPITTAVEDSKTAAKTADFINLLCGTALIESMIIQISQPFAAMLHTGFPYGVAVR
jgi:hypothetical protein